MRTIKEIDAELSAYLKAMTHTDSANLDAMGAHAEELMRERGRAMGLSEEEISRLAGERSGSRRGDC
jgi:hypothetical protein